MRRSVTQNEREGYLLTRRSRSYQKLPLTQVFIFQNVLEDTRLVGHQEKNKKPKKQKIFWIEWKRVNINILVGGSPLAIALDEFCPLVEQFSGGALEKCVL